MNQEQFRIIAKKYAENECNDAEKRNVETFLEEMQHRANMDIVLLSDKKGQKMADAVYAARTKIRKKTLSVKIKRVAAVLVLAIGIGFLIKQSLVPGQVVQITNRGEKKEIILQDGSIVVLNRNSSISYPETFGETRNIKLTGEAYFKVKRNPEKPFIVSMHDMTLKVLGTSFNINSYSENPTKVSVLTGTVALNAYSGQQVILTKNQQADFKNAVFNVTKEQSREKIAWVDNIIILKQTTLAETAKILENWYNVDIVFEDTQLEKLIINGKFKEEKLDNVLASIAFVKKIKIDYLTKNKIIIRRDTTNY
ncbi:FecR family protein [Flavobacterium sp. ARAG 55.4]|uniref:FecR family protein n=1 Tax=Flavobacterium sp. ARAG 55.4 TaxID=3451357 RepID=UPI003F452BF8